MKDLLDTDGENRAVRAFLLAYPDAYRIKNMIVHMRNSGFDVVPDWALANPEQHLTKGGAQLWLRMLFALEEPLVHTHQHIKSKGMYIEVGRGRLQSDVPVGDGTTLVAYKGVYGDLWFRLG